MPRTDVERDLNRKIYEDLHLKQGKTAEAALTAAAYLTTIDTKNFTDIDRAEAHDEFAYQTVVLAIASARKSKDPVEIKPLLELAMIGITDHYPVSENLGEAEQRNAYWEPVFGGLNAHMRCLRDCIKLLAVLEHVGIPDRYQSQISAMLFHLNVIADMQQSESGQRILRIEKGNKIQASRAFGEYLLYDGLTSLRTNTPELKDVFGKMWKKLRNNEQLSYPFHNEFTIPIDGEIVQRFLALRFVGMGKAIYSVAHLETVRS